MSSQEGTGIIENSWMTQFFFYNSCYHPVQGHCNRLEAIPLLIFTDSYWPLPDMATSVAFRAGFREDCRSSTKPNTCYKATDLS